MDSANHYKNKHFEALAEEALAEAEWLAEEAEEANTH
jgi:hypothetical protein